MYEGAFKLMCSNDVLFQQHLALRIGSFGFLCRRPKVPEYVFGESHWWTAEQKQRSLAMTVTAYFSYDVCRKNTT